MGRSWSKRRSLDPSYRGKEIFEIKPVILGGSATDPENKVLLTREEHIKAVAHWNRVIKDLRNRAKSEESKVNLSEINHG
jgi:hypothetical protein